MPIERRPANPIAKGPRPGTRITYKVTDSDSLVSIAQKYSIPVTTLMQHNFATLDPPEINWYLRAYVGCTKATTDGKNWVFTSSANPGLIYIPASGAVAPRPPNGAPPPPNGGGVGAQPPSVPGDDDGTLPFALKLSYEMKSPIEEISYFRLQAVLGIDGTAKPADPNKNPPTVGFNPQQGKLSAEVAQKVWDIFTFSLKAGMTMDDLATVIDAIKYGDRGKFVQEFSKLLQAKVALKGEFYGLTVKPAGSLELSTTPIGVEVSFGHEGPLLYEGSPYKYSVMVKEGIKMGPSAMAWRWIARKIGVPAVRAFVQDLGPEVAATVAYWCGFVLLAVGETIAVTYLFEWAINHAYEVADRMTAASWYARHYSDAVFEHNHTYTTLPLGFSENAIGRRMIELAGLDLIADMRSPALLIDVPPLNPVPYRENEPGFWLGAKQALDTYRRYMVAASNGNESLARDRMTQAALNKAWKALDA